jgi:hypothetical protein
MHPSWQRMMGLTVIVEQIDADEPPQTCGIDFLSATYAAATRLLLCCCAPGCTAVPTGPAQSVRAHTVAPFCCCRYVCGGQSTASAGVIDHCVRGMQNPV